jgi:hypothetical protein
MSCRAAGSSAEANPLDSAVKPIPAAAACRLAHSWPLIHYAAARIMSAVPGWLVPGRRVGVVCAVRLAAAGAAALPVPDVGEGVLDGDPFAQFRPPLRGLLALAQLGQQRLIGVDGDAAPVAAGGAAGPQRAGGAGVLWEPHGLAGLERHGHPGGAGQLPSAEVEGELVLGEPAAGVADPPGLAVDGQVRAAVADQGPGR